MPDSSPTKVCTKCGKEKSVSEYYKQKDCKYGVTSKCKDCCRAAKKVHYYKDPEKARSESISWARRNPEHKRNTGLRYKYGVDSHWYDSVLAAQNGVCAICGEPPQEGKHLCVDHNHLTGANRGLLCDPCNQGIGLLRESQLILKAASHYLAKYQHH